MTAKMSFELRNRAIEAADREVVSELQNRSGISISSISDLVQTRQSYFPAYPVLLDLLRRPYPVQIREMIVRALTVKDAHDVAFPTLVQIYRDPSHKSDSNDIGFKPFRFALANAIAFLASPKERSTLKEFARDAKLGASRSAFIHAMRTWRDPEVDDLVLGALGEPDLRYQAIVAAGTRRITRALPAIEAAAADRDPEVRRVASRAIDRIRANAVNQSHSQKE